MSSASALSFAKLLMISSHKITLTFETPPLSKNLIG